MSVYACSDLHGNGIIWHDIQKYLKDNDTLYFLGDACDRGPDGWEIIKEMLADSRVIYLCGNHEDILYKRLQNPRVYKYANLHNINGGEPTWNSALKDGEAYKVKEALASLPRYAEYTNADGLKIFMSHSGDTDIEDDYALIWDRNHYYSFQSYIDCDIVIHGHTTIPHLIDDLIDMNTFYIGTRRQIDIPDWDGGAYWYYNGHRCDIDCCTVKTNKAVLLNLDNFEETVFEGF